MPKDYLNYLPLAIVILIVLRRAGRPQKVRVERAWINPLLALVGVWSTMSTESFPSPAAILIFAVAILLGTAAGYFRALHMALSVDAESGQVMSKPTQLGTVLIVVFLLLRVGLNYLTTGKFGPAARFAQPHQHGVDIFRLADAALLFTTAMLLAQRGEIVRRAYLLRREHKRASAADA